MGQCSLIKPECVKARERRRASESYGFLLSLWFLLCGSAFHMYERKEASKKIKKDSAKKVYNALKPVRHSPLYIKSVNSLG